MIGLLQPVTGHTANQNLQNELFMRVLNVDPLCFVLFLEKGVLLSDIVYHCTNNLIFFTNRRCTFVGGVLCKFWATRKLIGKYQTPPAIRLISEQYRDNYAILALVFDTFTYNIQWDYHTLISA